MVFDSLRPICKERRTYKGERSCKVDTIESFSLTRASTERIALTGVVSLSYVNSQHKNVVADCRAKSQSIIKVC